MAVVVVVVDGAQMMGYRDLTMAGEMGSDGADEGLVGPAGAFSVVPPFGIFLSPK